MIRASALAAATLALGACTARESAVTQRFASLDAALPSGPGRRSAPTPVVVLPAWIGRPVALRERDGPGGFEQEIALAPAGHRGGGDHRVRVVSPRDGALDAVLGGKPTEAGIRAELAGAFPGVAMQVVTRSSANAYGPYGLAIGRAGAMRCLYAWQWIPAAPVLEGGGSTPLSLRLRLCRNDVTFEAMAAAVTQLRLVPRFSGTPVPVPSAVRPLRQARPVPMARPAPVAPAPASDPAPAGPRYLGTEGPERRPSAASVPGLPLRGALLGAIDGPGPSPAAARLPPGAAILPPEATGGPAPRHP
ncbi:cellulose biosynthesis protein BcsN [Methylobacterium nonmethylotrophicum]|uniref:Cellulose biosynthesis protein BcsN n=1 Tax=Methylobacterium nonmethylotrophicum TaxID=1141884 RepID=A0A4Z0NJC5_9HYPH|nr:cellulose biosynthesis protein BcsN [Methylobacterium nonmethylotrophicum]TGD95931.1 hypothetical protein EU555_25445 [Methylobacterium nonmethylotrophicum]